MATRERPLDRGRARAASIARRIGAEIRRARISAGVSQRAAAEAVGMSHTTFGRIERGELGRVTVRQLALACAAVGLELKALAYLDGDPVRDSGQRRLLERFRVQLLPGTGWRTEVRVAGEGDLRAIDGVAGLRPRPTGVEAETHLDDIQALERRAMLKQRDSGISVLILLVADTRHNRGVLAIHREALRAAFPLDGRAVMQAVREGRTPRANGIVVM
jgi:transcriptional regulator with XRE-family HTH domain